MYDYFFFIINLMQILLKGKIKLKIDTFLLDKKGKTVHR